MRASCSAAPRSFRPGLETLEPRDVPSLTNPAGFLLSATEGASLGPATVATFQDTTPALPLPVGIHDPRFAAPNVGTGSYYSFAYHPPGAAWSFNFSPGHYGSGVAGNGSGFTSGNPDAPGGGTQVAFLQGAGAVISQSVLFSSGTYTLNFLAAQRGNWNQGGQTFEVDVDGAAVGTFTPAGTSYAAYTTGAFTVTAGAHTIAFIGLNPLGGDNTAFVTGVSAAPDGGLAGGGFEDPNVGTGTYYAFAYAPAGTAWSYNFSPGYYGSGVAGNGSGFTSGNPDAPEGTQAGFLQGAGSSISQTLDLAAGSYAVRFQAAQRGNWQPAGPQSFQVALDGTVLGTFTPGATRYAGFATDPVSVTAGSHTLTFTGRTGGDSTAFLDQVRLRAAPNGGGDGYTATVDWGDGTTSAGTVIYDAGTDTFSVVAGHTYAEEGSYPVATTVTHGGDTLSISSTAAVADAPLSAVASPLTADTNDAVSGPVAYFTEANPNAPLSDYTATVDWGNGTQSAGTVSAVSPVSDSSFEAPNVGSGTFNAFVYDPTGSAWTFLGSAGVAGDGSGFTSGNSGAPDGTQVAFVQQTGSFSQSVVLPAGTYTLSFLAGQRANWNQGGQAFAVQVDGNTVGTFTPSGSAYISFTTNAFTVTAGAHALAFVGLNPLGGDNTAFVDQVQVNGTFFQVTGQSTYAHGGTYPVNVTIRDLGSGGFSQTATVGFSITVANRPPVVNPDSPYLNDQGMLEVDLTEGDTVSLKPQDIAVDPDGDPIAFVPGSQSNVPNVTLSSDSLTFTGATVGDSFVTFAIQDNAGAGNWFRVLFHVRPLPSLLRMDISGHYDLPLEDYYDPNAPNPVTTATAATDFGTLYLGGNRLVAARYEQAGQALGTFTADTVFVLNFKPPANAPGRRINSEGIAFDTDDQLNNGGDVYFLLNGFAGPTDVTQGPYLQEVQREDGSYDVTIHIGAYLQDRDMLGIEFTKIAFVNEVGPDDSSATATFTDIFQVTESTLPSYLPYLQPATYTIIDQPREVRADQYLEGLSRDDYLERFNSAKGTQDSARTYGLFDLAFDPGSLVGANAPPVPSNLLAPIPTFRLQTGPALGTMNTADGNALNLGDVMNLGTFVYQINQDLGSGSDSFICELTLSQVGGPTLQLRQRASIYTGYGTSFPSAIAAGGLVGTPVPGVNIAARQPIPDQFHEVLGMGGGGGDGMLVYDAFKQSGAKHLVVISSAGTYTQLQNQLYDFAGSYYLPFDRIDAFFISTQEQAELQVIKNALTQNDTAVYFTGGDQTAYLDIFGGTGNGVSFLRTIDQQVNAGDLSFGGSSAGLAIQGERAFHGDLIDTTKSYKLLDPNQVYDEASFRHYVRFTDQFLNLQQDLGITPVLTETHFKERDRMARFVSFLTQTQQEIDAGTLTFMGAVAHGIAVDEGTALIVDCASGIGTVRTTPRRLLDLPGYVFFGKAQVGTEIGFVNGELETANDVDILRLGAGASFDLAKWQSLGVQAAISGSSFEVGIAGGLASSSGLPLPTDVYYPFSTLDPRLIAAFNKNGEVGP